MRHIDADALLMQIEEYKLLAREPAAKKIIEMIHAATTYVYPDVKKDWISVNDRLPEADGFYIVCMNGDIWGEPEVWRSTACGFYDGKWDEADANISHWMRFPISPKEDTP